MNGFQDVFPILKWSLFGGTFVHFQGCKRPSIFTVQLPPPYAEAGLTVGMSSLAAGMAIGVVGDAGVRANAQQPGMPNNVSVGGGFHVRWVRKNGVVQYGGIRDDKG